MTVAPPVQEMVERLAKRGPVLCRLVESLSTAIVEAVILPVRALLRRDDVRVQGSGLVQTPQRAIDRRIANVIQAVFPEPPDGVGQHGAQASTLQLMQRGRGRPARGGHHVT